MRVFAVLLGVLALTGPAAAADREVFFGDPFRFEAADAGPFDRLADGRLICLSEACAGRTVAVGAVTVRVLPRVSPEQVAAPKPAYRAQTALPAPEGSGPAAALLFSAAGLAALLAAGLGAAGLRTRRGDLSVDLLLRALRLVRESATRSPSDRRRALDHLATTLGDVPLAERATRLAWARPEPDPATTRAVADEVAG